MNRREFLRTSAYSASVVALSSLVLPWSAYAESIEATPLLPLEAIWREASDEVQQKIKNDFDSSRVVDLDGWLISETEFELLKSRGQK